MSKKRLVNQGILFVLFVVLSLIVFTIVDRGIHFMLAWNAFLAFIPIGILYLFDSYKDKKILSVFLFLVWLFFYPNSLYLITDLIYINQDAFMQDQGIYQGLIYLQDFNAYLGFFHLFLGALYGLTLSLISFRYFYAFFRNLNKKYHLYFYIICPILVSIAIYIGRFLRFNTWDIIDPINLLVRAFNSIDGFALLYIALFVLIQYIIFTYDLLIKKKLL